MNEATENTRDGVIAGGQIVDLSTVRFAND